MDFAFLPARLLGRWRSDIAESVAVDEERFAAGPRWALPALLVFAVLLPVAASLAHAIGPPNAGGDSLALALRPFFDVVYAESLPFMIATVGIGLFSPGIGVLFMLVFIPADYLAASYSNVELANQTWVGFWPGAWFARPASWLLLWVLAVEIPIRIRHFTIDWAFDREAEPSPIRSAVVQMAATTVLVAAWAATVPWLVKPVYSWTMIQTVPSLVTDPTWYYWWILVIGATILGGLSIVFPSSLTSAAAVVQPLDRPPDTRRRPVVVAARQLLTVAMLALLLIGLMTTIAEGVLIILGLFLAGPVLTLALPRIKAPLPLARASGAVRWVAAMAVAVGVSFLIFLLAGPDKFKSDYFVLAFDFAIVAPLVRLILEAGAAEDDDTSFAAAPNPPAAVVTSALLALGLAIWLALPAVALADNCSDTSADELPSCAGAGAGAAAVAAGAGAAAAGAALQRKRRTQGRGKKPHGWKEIKVSKAPGGRRKTKKTAAAPAPEPTPADDTPPRPEPLQRRPEQPPLKDFEQPPPPQLPGKANDLLP